MPESETQAPRPETEESSKQAPTAEAEQKATGSETSVAEELPVNTCVECGKLQPGQPVYQCMLCMQYVCVRHLNATLHACYNSYT